MSVAIITVCLVIIILSLITTKARRDSPYLNIRKIVFNFIKISLNSFNSFSIYWILPLLLSMISIKGGGNYLKYNENLLVIVPIILTILFSQSHSFSNVENYDKNEMNQITSKLILYASLISCFIMTTTFYLTTADVKCISPAVNIDFIFFFSSVYFFFQLLALLLVILNHTRVVSNTDIN